MQYDCIHKPHSPSTNSELISALKSAALSPKSAIRLTASTQSQGRGQHGRVWQSPPGNVYLSFYTPMQAQADFGLKRLSGTLSLVVGLCLQQMPTITVFNEALLSRHLPYIGVKWANDVGFYDGAVGLFGKLSGILIEPVYADGVLLGAVIGVGMNIQNAPVITDGLYRATCLNDIARTLDDTRFIHHDTDFENLYAEISRAIIRAIRWHNDLSDTRGVHLDAVFVQAFDKAHTLDGVRVGIFEQNQKTPSHIGVCTGIHHDGSLRLLGDDGQMILATTGMAVRL